MMRSSGWRLALGGGLMAAAVLALSAGTLFAQMEPASPAPPTHQQMHAMMDAMQGEGFSERMHQAMPGSEEMMNQCAAMMGMMQRMDGMMGQGGMPGMTGR